LGEIQSIIDAVRNLNEEYGLALSDSNIDHLVTTIVGQNENLNDTLLLQQKIGSVVENNLATELSYLETVK